MPDSSAAVGLPAVDFLLPGRWWRVPLDSEASIASSSRQLAREIVGAADDRAALRHDLTVQMAVAAAEARKAGGQDFYFVLEFAPGERVPLSMAVYWPEMPETLSAAASPGAAATAMSARFVRLYPAAEVETLRDGEVGLVRVVEEYQGVAPATEIGDVARLTLSYWFFDARWPRTFLMSFSTPLVAERESVVRLCDAISAGVTWES